MKEHKKNRKCKKYYDNCRSKETLINVKIVSSTKQTKKYTKKFKNSKMTKKHQQN